LHLVSVDVGGRREETWQADGGRRERTLFGDVETVMDWDAGVQSSYVPARNQVVTVTDAFRGDPLGLAAGQGGHVLDDLALLLDRAKAGDADVHLVGETTVRGVPVYELRFDYVFHGVPPVRTYRLIYLNRETFLPVRVVEHFPAGETTPAIDVPTDYLVAERLPRTPENERLLEMSPHPGASHVTERAP
jgi:hypothetical protein